MQTIKGFYVYLLSSFYIGVRSFVKSTGFLFLFPPPLHSIVNLFTVCPVRTKTFSTHVASKMVHVVRKTGLSTHAGNEPPASPPPPGAFIRLPPEPDAATPCF